jgi:hypothetical protein
MYVDEVCRSLHLLYTGEEMTWRDITLYPYEINLKDFDNTTMNPANEGFYQYGPNGLSNMTVLANVPLFLSKPHFLDSQQSLLEALDGIQPYKEIHDTYLAVEPITGMTFRAFKRLQLSTRVTSLFCQTNKQEIKKETEGTEKVNVIKKKEEVEEEEEDPIHSLFEFFRRHHHLLQELQEEEKMQLNTATISISNVFPFLDKEIESCMIDSPAWDFFNSELYIPMTWSEESFEVPTALTDEFKSSVYASINFVNSTHFWLLLSSSTLLFSSLIALLLKKHLEKKFKSQTSQNSSQNSQWSNLEQPHSPSGNLEQRQFVDALDNDKEENISLLPPNSQNSEEV